MRVAHEIEGCAPVVCLVDEDGEDYSGGAGGGRPGEGDDEAAEDKHLIETLKVTIVRFRADGTKGVARLLEGSGDVRESKHCAEGGRERVGGSPVFFLISDLAYYIEECHCGRY